VCFEDTEQIISLGVIFTAERPTFEDGHDRARRKAQARGPFTYEDVKHSFMPSYQAGAARP